MLTTNSRNDKLAAARIDFSSRGMLDSTCLGEALKNLCNTLEDDDDNEGDTEVEDHTEVNPGDREEGQDLDADDDEDPTGPVDGLPAPSEVSLALKRG